MDWGNVSTEDLIEALRAVEWSSPFSTTSSLGPFRIRSNRPNPGPSEAKGKVKQKEIEYIDYMDNNFHLSRGGNWGRLLLQVSGKIIRSCEVTLPLIA
ncbi:hypothetical protein RND71_035854 [Anisodus tanguticus]|uniref:Uncharacterized protein n=1 Tax=Anisodus tanguticus TaxID=243964 RepID=A0AAE1R6E6_9SOLA|nr:hypothetical protein RND71_035854 [Anisodus tanguticus]